MKVFVVVTGQGENRVRVFANESRAFEHVCKLTDNFGTGLSPEEEEFLIRSEYDDGDAYRMLRQEVEKQDLYMALVYWNRLKEDRCQFGDGRHLVEVFEQDVKE